MKKLFYIFSTMLLLSVACKKDDTDPETKRVTIYDTTKVIDRYVDSIFHHFYDTLSVYDTVRVPILCDHSWIVYVLNNGTEQKDSLYVKNGATINLKSDIIRSGYDFVKWSTSTNGYGSEYKAGDNYYVSDDITLYAIWQSRNGLRSNEVYDFLSKQEKGSTVDVKIIDLRPDFKTIKTALSKCATINVNLDLEDAIELPGFSIQFNVNNVISIKLPSISNISNLLNKAVEDISDVVITDGIDNLNGLTSLVIPTGVKIISICSCRNLSSIEIPETIEYLDIRGCPINEINIPNGIRYLHISNANMKSLSLPNSLEYFSGLTGCQEITEITIPEKIESMYMHFEGCKKLQTINHSLKECKGVNFKECSNLKSITIPEFGLNTSSIPSDAFQSCSSLETIELPKSITNISVSAFNGCTKLTNLTFKSLTPPILETNEDDIWFDYSGKIYVPSSAVNDYKTADIWKDHASQIVGY